VATTTLELRRLTANAQKTMMTMLLLLLLLMMMMMMMTVNPPVKAAAVHIHRRHLLLLLTLKHWLLFYCLTRGGRLGRPRHRSGGGQPRQ